MHGLYVISQLFETVSQQPHPQTIHGSEEVSVIFFSHLGSLKGL